MAFYCPDPDMDQLLVDLVERLEREGRPDLGPDLSITWLRYDSSIQDSAPGGGSAAFWGRPIQGASWNGRQQRYPASVVKLVYLVAAEAWLQERLIADDPELRRALAEMVRDSSNDATGLVVDLLSGTTSGPSLPPDRMRHWVHQRELVNAWLAGLNWNELEGVNACQKTWGDGPFGREREFYGGQLENRNRLSADATARLLHAVMAGALVTAPACQRMRELLGRSLDPESRAADPENQVDGFIGGALAPGDRLWSKAGWMSQARHDAAYVEPEKGAPFLLVVFSEGRRWADDEELLPAVTSHLMEAGAQIP